jgi:hypothetical protein
MPAGTEMKEKESIKSNHSLVAASKSMCSVMLDVK